MHPNSCSIADCVKPRKSRGLCDTHYARVRRGDDFAPRHQHGLSKTLEYASWVSMISRCYRQANPNFHRYGGRGIKVCAAWRDSFEVFLRDMGPRPSLEYTLERKDNEGDYTPSNCKWATRTEQQRNTSANRMLAVGKEIKSLAEWCSIFRADPGMVTRRLKKGLDPETSLIESAALCRLPKEDRHRKIRGAARAEVLIRIEQGESQTSLARSLGVTPSALSQILNRSIQRSNQENGR